MKNKKCIIKDCDTKPGKLIKNLCSKHYQRLLKHGDPNYFKPRTRVMSCKVEGCSRPGFLQAKNPHFVKGYCPVHYQKFLTYGDPTAGKTLKVHGHYKNKVATPTYVSWTAMLNRCTNSNQKNYSNYGGRGIKVCDDWLEFVNFLRDMGKRPEGKTLDRINVNGNYEPGNCRWATRKEQANNKRNTIEKVLDVLRASAIL